MELAALVVLAAVWGGSFLFIRVAAPALGPLPLSRVVLGVAGVARWLLHVAARPADPERS